MTRDELGAVARDLRRGDTRAAALARVLAQRPRRALPLAALTAVPAWLRIDPDARARVARRAALAGIAPLIARSVDGAWLGGLARAAGDDALDWAAGQPGPQRLEPFDGSRLGAIADGLIRAATPAALHDFVESGEPGIEPGAAASLLEAAMRP